MCDYSLMAIPNRVAVSGDDLVVHRFQTGSLGLASASDLRKGPDPPKIQSHSVWLRFRQFFHPPDTGSPPAICVPPGARLLVQDIPSELRYEHGLKEVEEAVFVQVTAHVNTFRDAVRFHNGVAILVQSLDEGQRIHVLDLSPAERMAAALEGQQRTLAHSFQYRV